MGDPRHELSNCRTVKSIRTTRHQNKRILFIKYIRHAIATTALDQMANLHSATLRYLFTLPTEYWWRKILHIYNSTCNLTSKYKKKHEPTAFERPAKLHQIRLKLHIKELWNKHMALVNVYLMIYQINGPPPPPRGLPLLKAESTMKRNGIILSIITWAVYISLNGLKPCIAN